MTTDMKIKTNIWQKNTTNCTKPWRR